MARRAKPPGQIDRPARLSFLSRGLILLAVLLGVLGAVVVKGRMAHLRTAIGGSLPAWTTVIDPSAGLLAGGATAAGLRVVWRAAAPEGATLLWALTLSSAADAAQTDPGTGRLAVDLRHGTVALTMAGGRVDLADFVLSELLGRLPGLNGPLRLSGRFDLTELDARLPIGGGLADLQATGRANMRNLTLDGTGWGGGRVSGAVAPGGPAVAQVALSGGVAPIRADLTLPAATATRLSISTEIGDAPGLPTDLRRLLETVATRDGPVWRFATTITLE